MQHLIICTFPRLLSSKNQKNPPCGNKYSIDFFYCWDMFQDRPSDFKKHVDFLGGVKTISEPSTSFAKKNHMCDITSCFHSVVNWIEHHRYIKILCLIFTSFTVLGNLRLLKHSCNAQSSPYTDKMPWPLQNPSVQKHHKHETTMEGQLKYP